MGSDGCDTHVRACLQYGTDDDPATGSVKFLIQDGSGLYCGPRLCRDNGLSKFAGPSIARIPLIDLLASKTRLPLVVFLAAK